MSTRRKICLSAIHGALFILIASAIFLFWSGSAFALTNGNFELVDLSPWETYSGANAALVTDPVRTGVQAVKVKNTSTSSYGIQQVVTGISEGKTYRFSGYGKITDSNVAKVFLRIAWYESSDGTGSQKSTDDSNQITEIGDWVGLAVEKTAPSGVASVKVRAILSSKISGTEAFAFFDDLDFEEMESSPTPTSTPTPTPSPVTGTYKINDVKNEEGNTLSNVEVYVDGEYTHHYAPETLTFGEGKYCDDDKQIECGFGEHEISLKEDGYDDWYDTVTIELGFYEEVDPIMNSSGEASSSTPTPTPTPAGGSPTPTKKPTPTKTPTPTPTPSGEILGEEATPEAKVISFNVSQDSNPSSFNPQKLLPFIFIGLGSLFLAIAGGSVLLPQIKKKYNKKRGENKPLI